MSSGVSSKKKVLFGFSDVLTLDAWLDHFENLELGSGFEVDGAMSGEDLLATAKEFKPDYLVTELKLKGEMDGLGLFYSLLAEPGTSGVRLVLIYGSHEAIKFSEFIASSGVLGLVHVRDLSFKEVESVLSD